jgi:hypothetical protein
MEITRRACPPDLFYRKKGLQSQTAKMLLSHRNKHFKGFMPITLSDLSNQFKIHEVHADFQVIIPRYSSEVIPDIL